MPAADDGPQLAVNTLPTGSSVLRLCLKWVFSVHSSYPSELILGHGESSRAQCCPSVMIVTKLGLVVFQHNGNSVSLGCQLVTLRLDTLPPSKCWLMKIVESHKSQTVSQKFIRTRFRAWVCPAMMHRGICVSTGVRRLSFTRLPRLLCVLSAVWTDA